MEAKRTKINGRAVPVHGDDIDTDSIIPARYLRCVTFDGLGRYAFYDERFDKEESAQDHPFNDPRFNGAAILLVNRNFGCGSSREHAPQALMRFGLRAFVGESFAEIFFGNCLALGLPAVCLRLQDIEQLMALVEKQPETELLLDLEQLCLTAGEIRVSCTIPESARQSLLGGTWDTTAVLTANMDKILAKAKELPYLNL